MTTVAIPHWNALGLLPPSDPARPVAPDRSPYPVSLSDIIERFATSSYEGRTMNRTDRVHLEGERGFLKRQLAELPVTAWMTRMSAESRLRTVEAELAAHPVDEREPARVQLTFKGRPVVGTHGIAADFGAVSVQRFTDAIAAMASSLSAPLKASGPIPDRDLHQMIITGTALGSFGFELEEYRAGQLSLDETSPVAEALDRTQRLLRGTLGTDEELAESAFDIDTRALDKVQVFLKTLADADAVCTMVSGDAVVRFADVSEVKRSLARLGRDHLRETEETLLGTLLGVLPKSRAFEFRLAEGGAVVRGKVSAAVEDIDALNGMLNREMALRMMVTRVGQGRPRYLLVETPTPDSAST